jgi:hypothetical protein
VFKPIKLSRRALEVDDQRHRTSSSLHYARIHKNRMIMRYTFIASALSSVKVHDVAVFSRNKGQEK